MARWKTFSPPAPFAFDAAQIAGHWARLHARDQEPLPQEPALLQAWSLFHNGAWEDAHRAGLRLGASGLTVANKAACVYALRLETRPTERLVLCEAVAQRAQAHAHSQPDNPNAHYLLACALGQYSQGVSVAQALAQGLGGRIKAALETTIALQARHADAHFALGAFHAEIIDKIGPLIAHMTYGARKEVSLQMFQQGFALQPDSPLGLVEYATALRVLEGDARTQEARTLCARAAALQALDAHEYLEIAAAREALSG